MNKGIFILLFPFDSTKQELPLIPPAQNCVALLEDRQLSKTFVPGEAIGNSTFLKVLVATDNSRYALFDL